MTTFIDTSVLIPLITEDSDHHRWCKEKFEQADRPVVVSDIVYAEFTVGMNSQKEADDVMERLALSRVGYADDVLFRAGRAFLEYRRNGGPRDSLLPDFLVGALADVDEGVLLTRDPAKVRTYFPDVQLIVP